MNRIDMRKLLLTPPISGYRAAFWAAVAVAIPTLLRALVHDVVIGAGVTPFVPFVLLSAIFLNWKYAAAVALGAAVIADAFFIGPPPELLEGPSDIFSIAIFLTSSAIMIGFAHLVRKSAAGDRQAEVDLRGIVFSEEAGEAWAGWRGRSSRVHLGQQDEVAEMMEDFLAHRELAKHLNRKAQ